LSMNHLTILDTVRSKLFQTSPPRKEQIGQPSCDWTSLAGLGRDPFHRLWARRIFTVPLYFLLLGLSLVLAPLAIPLAALIDLMRRSPWVLCRTILFLLLYLACEGAGITASFFLWLAASLGRNRSAADYLWRNFALQNLWVRVLAGGAFRLFSIRLEVEGLEDYRGRPILLFCRHVSTADTVLPAYLVAEPQRILLRYVIKRELLLDPCLDIVGNRLPNYFVRRGSGESETEIERVKCLLRDLRPGHGVLMYPEGTRFTPSKRERILKRLAEKGDRESLRRALGLQFVLPPRLGGSLAILENNPGADAVFCAHAGLESTTSIGRLWRGGLVGSTVRVKFWRVPYEEIPRGKEALIEWLWREWSRVNAFVGRYVQPGSFRLGPSRSP